jgi:hypothetical protein
LATYKEIQLAVKEQYGFTPKTCWIAHVLSIHGLTTRQAPNRISASKPKHLCPDDKRAAIEAVLRGFKMIP